MGKKAARLTDLTKHAPVVIVSGSPDTKAGYLPSARLFDLTAPCPICKIPNKGLIISASRTVFINRLGAARVDDKVLCGAGLMKPPGCSPPPVAEYGVRAEDNYVEAVFTGDAHLVTETGTDDAPETDAPPERKPAKFFKDLSMSISMGSAFGMSTPGGGPNSIAMGCSNVFIGD
jgi:uncharacterized Zn-binding protein involved in type VI secretion